MQLIIVVINKCNYMVDLFTIFVISIFAGFIGSLTGLGGGGITIPFLTYLGVPVKYAIAASMVSIIATSSGSAASYVKEKIANVRSAMYLEMFTIIGAIVGATITTIVQPKLLYFLFGGFLLASFVGIISKHIREEVPSNVRQDRMARWLKLEGRYYDRILNKEITYKLTNPAYGGVGMFFAGIIAGMLGIGAGAFKVSIHELILRMPSKVSTATSNFIIGITALAGSSIYFASGLLYLDLIAPMAVGAIIGSVIGSRILIRLSNKNIRLLFLVVMSILGVQMIYRGLLLK
jgi:uncharacterized membrane protein YfcA